MSVDRNKVLDAWSVGEPASSLAARFECSERNVYRIAQKARSDGDARGDFPDDRTRERFIARMHMDAVVARYVRGEAIEHIADKEGIQPHIVRAAIYLATQDGVATGLSLSTGGG